MKLRKFIAASAAAISAVAVAGAANAAITVVATTIDNLYGDPLLPPSSALLYGQTMLDDFDAILNPYVSYDGNVLQGPNQSSTSASPPYNFSLNGDTTKYASVQGSDPVATFAIAPGNYLKNFSFYLGSPDTYNTISFYDGATLLQSFSGGDIWGADFNAAGGQRDWGYRIYYDFGGASVTSITFDSHPTNAFEFDGLAGALAVPEPGSWALMLLGFGGLGAVLRNRRRAGLAVA